jgi:hypothetical protein
MELIRFRQNDRLGLPLISIFDLSESPLREDHASGPSGSCALLVGIHLYRRESC